MARWPALLLLLAAVVIDAKVTYHPRKRTCVPKVTTIPPPPNRSNTTTTTGVESRPLGSSTSSSKTSGVPATTHKGLSLSSESSTRTGATSLTSTSTKTTSNVPSGTPSGINRLRSLFPVDHQSKSAWSTSPLYDNPLPLDDKTLRVHKVSGGTTHNVTEAPDGKLGMEALYREGSISPSSDIKGGFSFYADGANDLTKGHELLFSYSVYFERGFQFNMGGKLPGFFGGDTDEVATSCSGGKKSINCFSLRLMWRNDGAGELYAYLPPGRPGNDQGCLDGCPYGAQIGTGAFTFKTGQWNTVAERVKLNDIGKANGEVEIFYNGKSVITLKGVTLCTSAVCRVRGLQCQTFFGGHTEEWASPKNQRAYFADWSAAIIS